MRKQNFRSGKKFNKSKQYSKKGFEAKSKSRCIEAKEDSPTNDPKWYETTPELLRDAASIPFSYATGTSYNLNFYGDNVAPSNNAYIPGILALKVVPTIGGDEAFNSPLNIATNSLFGQVRKANSGTANYDAPNLFMYCMSIAQIYGYINHLMRIYGTAQLYLHYNRYVPEALLNSMGVDFGSVQEHLADFRYGINVLIHKASSFACPAGLTYFNRLAFLFAGIYSEGESIKDQLYLYVPAGFMKLVEMDSTPGWNLEYVPMPIPTTGNSYLTVSQLLNYGTNLITPLLRSEDFNIISGDIIKAFGSNILGLQSLPEDYTIMPVTDLAVLEQMQNANIIGSVWSMNGITRTVQVKENPNTNTISAEVSLACKMDQSTSASYALSYLQARCNGGKLLTTILTDPTPSDVIERTRLMFTSNETTDSDDVTTLMIQTGSDVCVDLTLWDINPATGLPRANSIPIDIGLGSTVTLGEAQLIINTHCMLENFKFHPMIFYWDVSTKNAMKITNIAVDIDNYTVLSPSVVTNMNEAALLALLRVPNSTSNYK